MPDVVIVGGGITGLATAFRLGRALPAVRVTLLDAGARVGGNVGTETHDGFRIERGPNGFLDNKPGMVQLCRELGLGGRMIAASEGSRKNRFIFIREKLHKLPAGPLGLLTTPLLSLRGKLDVFREPFRKRPDSLPEDESIAEFVTRRAGQEMADVFADAMVTGIHGGDPAALSVAAAFPRLPQMEREHGSIIRGFLRAAKQKRRDAEARGEPRPGPARMWSFREGLGAVVETLAAQVGPENIRTGIRVQRLTPTANGWLVYSEGSESWPADAVVLTAPAHAQAPMLAELSPALEEELAAIPYNRIGVVAVGYRQTDVPHARDGFGYIAPQNTRLDLLGVQWCSSIFPERAPPGMVLWRALVGGVHRGEMLDWPDDRLVTAVHDEIVRAMDVRGQPVFSRVIRWPRAIPQYVRGHRQRVARIEALAAAYPGLFLAGNAFHGIALNDCAAESGAVAARVAAFLASS